nr:small integral membrane protein 34A [Marmota flaviventris]
MTPRDRPQFVLQATVRSSGTARPPGPPCYSLPRNPMLPTRGTVMVSREDYLFSGFPQRPFELTSGRVKGRNPLEVITGTPQTQASSLLSDPMEERNGTNSTRFLRLLEGTSAAWYILTIVGIYGVIIFFRLASNILKKNDKSFEDIYYSNLTYELKKKTFESKVAKCSSLTLSNTDVLQPGQASLGSKCAKSGPQIGTQGIH